MPEDTADENCSADSVTGGRLADDAFSVVSCEDLASGGVTTISGADGRMEGLRGPIAGCVCASTVSVVVVSLRSVVALDDAFPSLGLDVRGESCRDFALVLSRLVVSVVADVAGLSRGSRASKSDLGR